MNKDRNIKTLVFRILFFSSAALLMSCKGNKTLNPSGDFGAYYTHIVTNDEFEKTSRTGDYADIIVDLGKEKRKVYFLEGQQLPALLGNRKREKSICR